MADLERTQSTPALHTLDLQETRGRQRQNTSAGIHDPSPVSRSRSHSGGSADGLPPGAALVKTQTTAKMHTTLSAPREEDPMRQSSDTEASDAEGRPRAGDAPQTPEQAAPPRRESHCLGPKVEEPRCRSERCCWARRFCCRTSEYSSIEEQLSHGDSAKYRPDIKTCQPLAGLRRKRAELVTVRDLIYHGNAHQIHRLISQVRDGVEHEGHGVQFECSLLNDLLTRKVPNLEALERQPEPYDPDGGSTPLPRSNTYDGKLKNERAAMVVIDETESRGTDLQHTSSSPSRLPPQTDTTGLKGKAHAEVMLQALEVSPTALSSLTRARVSLLLIPGSRLERAKIRSIAE
eukprot:COSAG04_NODE_671_length_11329_cov_2.762867_1_plen_348_part_00